MTIKRLILTFLVKVWFILSPKLNLDDRTLDEPLLGQSSSVLIVAMFMQLAPGLNVFKLSTIPVTPFIGVILGEMEGLPRIQQHMGTTEEPEVCRSSQSVLGGPECRDAETE